MRHIQNYSQNTLTAIPILCQKVQAIPQIVYPLLEK